MHVFLLIFTLYSEKIIKKRDNWTDTGVCVYACLHMGLMAKCHKLTLPLKKSPHIFIAEWFSLPFVEGIFFWL